MRRKKKLIHLLRHVDLRTIWGKGKILCPWHNDHTPSLHVYPDHVYCFACQTWGSGIDLLRAQGLTFAEAVQELEKYKGKRVRSEPVDTTPVPLEMVEQWHQHLMASPEARAWLEGRGLRRRIVKALMLGWTEGRCYSIPHFVNGQVENVKFRVHPDYLLDDEPKYASIPHKPFTKPYPYDYFLQHYGHSKVVFVTEGEFDAMLLLQEGLPAVSLPSGITHYLSRWTSFWSRFDYLFVVFDQDEAGCKAVEKLFAKTSKVGRSESEKLNVAHVEDVVWNPAWGKDVTEARDKLIPLLQELYAQAQYQHDWVRSGLVRHGKVF